MLLVVGNKQSHVTCGWGYAIVCYLCLGIYNRMLLVVGDKQLNVTCGWG